MPQRASDSSISCAVSCTCMCTGRSSSSARTPDLLERRVADGVGRVRGERRAHEPAVAQFVMQRKPLIEVFLRRLRPGGGEVDEDKPDAGADAGLGCGARNDVREEVHVVEAGGAALQHLGDAEQRAVAHEVRAHPGSLRRPDVPLQPLRQHQVVGHAAEQGHGGVRMRVDQPRDQCVVVQIDGFRRLVARRRLTAVENGDDASLCRQRAPGAQARSVPVPPG